MLLSRARSSLRSGGAAERGRRVTFLPEGMMAYQECVVQRDQHRIYVRDHPGAEPAIILMHGMPDNLHLYDYRVRYVVRSDSAPSR
jgi:haloalkane dehalogenase